MLVKYAGSRNDGGVHVYVPQLEVWTKVSYDFMGIINYLRHTLVFEI
jgi:hypothetical protein